MILENINEYALQINDNLVVYGNHDDMEKMIVNFKDCLTEEGKLPIGTTWFNVSETLKPCTIKTIKDGINSVTLDGLYKVNGLGGYRLGYGCFYKELKNEKCK